MNKEINEFINSIKSFSEIHIERDFNTFSNLVFNLFNVNLSFTYMNTSYIMTIEYYKIIIDKQENIQAVFNFISNNQIRGGVGVRLVGANISSSTIYTVFPEIDLNDDIFSSFFSELLTPYNVQEVVDYFQKIDINEPHFTNDELEYDHKRKLKTFTDEFHLTPVYVSQVSGGECCADDGKAHVWLYKYGLSEDDVERIGYKINNTIDTEILYPDDRSDWILDNCESNVYAYPSINNIGILFFEDEDEALLYKLANDKEEK